MSYDIRISVRPVGAEDKFVVVDRPEYDSPTYNLRDMFEACMDWDYTQGAHYPCDFALKKIEHGLQELYLNQKKYKKYNPKNGWGSIGSAIEALESSRKCILEYAEDNDVPLECLYFSW